MLHQAKESQTEWFTRELQPHEAMLRAWLLARFPSLRDVDDIVQDASFKVLRSYENSGVEMKSPKAFLFATARNLAIDLLRRQKTVLFESMVENDFSLVFESETQAAEDLKRRDNLETITEVIQTLPNRC